MNTRVTATGMQVKAAAEGGIVISNEAKLEWKATASATNSALAELVPTSTANATQWYHAVSDDANDEKSEQDVGNYSTLSVTVNAGVGSASIGAETKAIYLVNKFYIKSSAEAITLTNPANLYINKVEAELPTTANTENLDKALRVAIVITAGETTVTKIFAPIEGAELTYKVKNTTSVEAIEYSTVNTSTGILNIPAFSSDTPIEAAVYCYFEGEDQNCKSANLAAIIDTITIQIQFGTATI